MMGRLSLLPLNTFNSTPAPASCKGIFAGLTLFDLFFFFLTLLKKYQKVQFACFALDTDGVLVYGNDVYRSGAMTCTGQGELQVVLQPLVVPELVTCIQQLCLLLFYLYFRCHYVQLAASAPFIQFL